MTRIKKLVTLVLAMCLVVSCISTVKASEALTTAEKAEVLYELGLFDGINDTEFVPDLEGTANREQAVKIVVKAFGWSVDDKAVTDFVDVSSWAQPYVALAVEKSLTNGTGSDVDGNPVFGAGESITARQLQTWFDRILTGSATAWEDNAGLDNMDAVNRGALVDAAYDALMEIPAGTSSSLIESIVAENSNLMTQAVEGCLITAEPLTIKKVNVVSDDEILVIFSENVTDSAIIESYYSLEQYGDNVSGIIKDVEKTASERVTITFKEALSGSYTIEVDGVFSYYGAEIDDQSDFKINDTVAATIDSIHVASIHMIMITCSEPLEEDSATDEDNYILYNASGDEEAIISSVKLSDDDEITMTFSDDLGGEYTIEFDGVEGRDGNTIKASKEFEVNISEALTIEDLEVDGDEKLIVTFSSPVSESSAGNSKNYAIFNDAGTNISIIMDGVSLTDDDEVIIELEEIFGIDTGGELTLKIDGVESEYGDRTIDDEVTFEID